MKKSKLFLPFTLFALLLSFGLASCNNAGDENSEPQSQQSSSIPQKVSIKVSAADNNTSLEVDETVQLTAKANNEALNDVSWSSSDDTTASVSDAGLVTAKKIGSATISAKKDGFTDGKITITVKASEIIVQIESGTSEGDVVTFKDSHNVDTDMVDAWPKDAVLTLNFTAKKAGAYELHVFCRAHGGYQSTNTDVVADTMAIKVNGNDVALSGSVEGGTFTDYKIGEVNLNAGNNVMTVQNLVESDSMITIDLFTLALKA